MAANRRQQLGVSGEDLAAEWYVARGYEIVDRNWRVKGGEIDVIATNGRVLVFCEVKTRTTLRFGSGFDAVTPAKQLRLRRLAMAWLAEANEVRGGRWRGALRFDVAAVLAGGPTPTIEVLEAAF